LLVQPGLGMLRRVRLERVTARGPEGYLVFVPHDSHEPWFNGTEAGLVVFISGDTLYSLITLLRGESSFRPMPLDVLAGVLSQTAGRSVSRFGVVHVAITALHKDTYIGRVFFGACFSCSLLAPEHTVTCAK
jgi:hypothetical protein